MANCILCKYSEFDTKDLAILRLTHNSLQLTTYNCTIGNPVTRTQKKRTIENGTCLKFEPIENERI